MRFIIIIIFSFLFITACFYQTNNEHLSFFEHLEQEVEPKAVLTSHKEKSSIPIKKDSIVDNSFTTIAFGSCNKHDLPQPLWNPILKNEPDLWIWLGDNIYGDSPDEAVLREKYAVQNNIEGYKELKEVCPIIGTWDDHDYGKNDGTKHFEGKEASKKAHLDFLSVSADDPVRKRDGIYRSYTYGEGNKTVKVIVLDTRTFRDKVKRDEQKIYVPDPEADILGEEQWKWFANELKTSKAPITLIVQGTQIISRFHRFEKWANYPTSRKRLFKMIKTHKPSGVILLSGDRHHGELSRVNIPDLKHPLYEFTSSGLTHTRKYPRPEPNKFRLGKKVDQLNFGVLRIDWAPQPIKVTLEIKGEHDKVFESHTFEVLK